MAITEQMGDVDFAIVRVWPCLKGSVLDRLMQPISIWLGESELGTSVMSLAAWAVR